MENIVVVIVGPTATGKTKLSIQLAKDIKGEIVSADSMQVYREMDIGTAKPTQFEMQDIPHYMIDEIAPDEEFSVAKYKVLACRYIDLILGKHNVPIVVGGTGLYVNSIIYNIDFSDVVVDWEYRERLRNEVAEKGNEYLYKKLLSIDPETASRLHINDIKRIIRALEVVHSTNKTISHYKRISRKMPSSYNFVIIGLDLDRTKLYQRINDRVDNMFRDGFVDEVRNLAEKGYNRNMISMQGIGYKEILAYLDGEMQLADAIELIKRNSRRYAKRQITWFKKVDGVKWVNAEKLEECYEYIVNNIKNMQEIPK